MAIWDRGRLIGAKSKYRPEMCTSMFKEFLQACENDAKNTALPTKAGYALFLGVHRVTLTDWENKHKAFRETMELLRTLQEEILIQGGLKNSLNQAIVCKLLAAHHNIGNSDLGDGGLIVTVTRGQS